jgi:stage II sporulation protein R
MNKLLRIINLHTAKNKFILGISLILFITVIFSVSICKSSAVNDQTGYKQHMIRFHVIANSDAQQDQILKEKVRDRIIQEMNPKMAKSKSLNETREIIQKNINGIKQIAIDEIRKNHQNDSVKVALGDFNFPTKSYGSITLPAGNYEALRVVIGKGEGSNWWCVLFPPLCFIDIERGLTDEKTKQEMMSVLTEEEFDKIHTVKSQDETPFKLKFKVVEIYEHAKFNVRKFVGENNL